MRAEKKTKQESLEDEVAVEKLRRLQQEKLFAAAANKVEDEQQEEREKLETTATEKIIV